MKSDRWKSALEMEQQLGKEVHANRRRGPDSQRAAPKTLHVLHRCRCFVGKGKDPARVFGQQASRLCEFHTSRMANEQRRVDRLFELLKLRRDGRLAD